MGDHHAAASRRKAAEKREIGEIPPIFDVDRRRRCGQSLRLFCETYNPIAFSLAWSSNHLAAIARIEEAAQLGALYAFAMPRGSGKSTISRMAALWSVSYVYRRYVFVIGANREKSKEAIDAIKTYMRFLPSYIEDFPEISAAVIALGGIANRASGQTCNDQPTMIEWSQQRVVLPTVEPPPNWPRDWPLRSDGMVPTSGAVIGGSGLSGEGIRGSLYTSTTGESIRPDLVLLDDPQTDSSARSKHQNNTRIRLVSGAVLGMAGPGKTISGIMPCTVIQTNDLADTILDRERHPLWRGERSRLMESMPANMEAWEPYFAIYNRCALKEPPDLAEANAYYIAHREILDDGAVASWPARKLPEEVSAIQHAMNLYARDPVAFAAEYQNDPKSATASMSLKELKSTALLTRTNGVPRGEVPRECHRLTAFIDCSGSLLWWVVMAWDERFGGSVVDYGGWPEQHRGYYTQADARPSLADKFPGYAEEARLYAGLRALAGDLLTRRFRRHLDHAETLKLELLLIDAGWSTDTVYRFVRENIPRQRGDDENDPRTSIAVRVLPSKGYAPTPSARSLDELEPRPDERAGPGWRFGVETTAGRARRVLFDTDFWKTFVANRFLMAPGSPGCLMLPGTDEGAVRLLADHLSAEYGEPKVARGKTWHHWTNPPERPDNHLWDCVIGAAVAASVRGLVWSAAAAAGDTAKAAKLKPLDIEEMYAKANGPQAGWKSQSIDIEMLYAQANGLTWR